MLKLLLFKIKLILSLGVFVIQLIANGSHKTKPLVLILFIIGLSLILGGLFSLKNSQNIETVVSASSVIPKHPQLFFVEKLTLEEINSKIIFFETVRQQQPYSRNVLLNLTQLYSALGNSEKATEYRIQALKIDPNNPLFE